MKTWRITELTGYQPITTFYEDFSIADLFGQTAIMDTYKRAFEEWKSDYKYLTEFVMVLNWKVWEHYETNDDYAKLYNELYFIANDYAYDTLKDEEFTYFYKTTN